MPLTAVSYPLEMRNKVHCGWATVFPNRSYPRGAYGPHLRRNVADRSREFCQPRHVPAYCLFIGNKYVDTVNHSQAHIYIIKVCARQKLNEI